MTTVSANTAPEITHDWQPRGHMTIMGKPLVLHTCAKCSVIKEFTHESFWTKCWGDLVAKGASQGDHKPDGSGLDDGPYLPGQAPRKRVVKTADEKAEARRKAWETRRNIYGQKGHK